jgi:hypothetical protein
MLRLKKRRRTNSIPQQTKSTNASPGITAWLNIPVIG